MVREWMVDEVMKRRPRTVWVREGDEIIRTSAAPYAVAPRSEWPLGLEWVHLVRTRHRGKWIWVEIADSLWDNGRGKAVGWRGVVLSEEEALWRLHRWGYVD